MILRVLTCTVALIGLAACNPAASMCREAANCSGNDGSVSDCVDNADASAQQARDAGCSSEYNAMNSCLHRNGTCDGTVYTVDVGQCGDSMGAFTQCVIGAAF